MKSYVEKKERRKSAKKTWEWKKKWIDKFKWNAVKSMEEIQEQDTFLKFTKYLDFACLISVACLLEKKYSYLVEQIFYIFLFFHIFQVSCKSWKSYSMEYFDRTPEKNPEYKAELGKLNVQYKHEGPSLFSRIYIYIYIYIYISSSSCRAGSTDIPDPLSPLLLSFIALGRSSGQHPVSSHSCWMYVHAGRPAFARPCVGVHKSTSLMSLSLLLQHVWFV